MQLSEEFFFRLHNEAFCPLCVSVTLRWTDNEMDSFSRVDRAAKTPDGSATVELRTPCHDCQQNTNGIQMRAITAQQQHNRRCFNQ
jgi:hypothetical protein